MIQSYRYLEPVPVMLVVAVGFIIAYFTETFLGGGYLFHLLISLGYGGTFLFFNITFLNQFPDWSPRRSVVLATVLGVTIGTLNMLIWIYIKRGVWRFELVTPFLIATTAIAFFVAYLIINRQRAMTAESELKDIQIRQTEQEKALINSQLRNLQGQMEPHFLFNTLANIQILIDTDKDKAKKLLTRITDLLRASLKQQRKDKITIAEEVKLLDSYLAIQQIRLSERMEYSIVLDDNVSPQALIPPFLIQPAVENAVVHGIEPSVKGGHIQIKFCIVEHQLMIEISDNGIGFNDASKGNGLSMKNVKERLSALFDGRGKLDLITQEGGGFITRMAIPCA
ncbi:histidine kinase [Enterovibrio sp. ZSDZ35]|uniref:Histidine kinase n=1 Tax=Enterovibrio qingdaonensis TaxID=2899818 RepID=A0ABT5QHF0_9GAMM|nr:histidine kinase [Enterovibrio sp. ZSDZ35]MDD1780074.1 histidine kinase [Enterovibrio sp. ZSDZ35]